MVVSTREAADPFYKIVGVHRTSSGAAVGVVAQSMHSKRSQQQGAHTAVQPQRSGTAARTSHSARDQHIISSATTQKGYTSSSQPDNRSGIPIYWQKTTLEAAGSLGGWCGTGKIPATKPVSLLSSIKGIPISRYHNGPRMATICITGGAVAAPL